MNVGELIVALSEYPIDVPVLAYVYGEIDDVTMHRADGKYTVIISDDDCL